MTSFLDHIISRHIGSSENVKPRVQSTFDHENFFSNDPAINDRQEGEEMGSQKKQAESPVIEITGPPTDIRKNKNKIPDPILKETISQVTEPIQLIGPRENNSESQQRSIKNTAVALLKKDKVSGENKTMSFREKIISRSQKEHTEGSLNKTGEKISEQKNKIASSTKGSLPALTEIDEPGNDDEIKPAALKDNGSTNVSPRGPGFKNKTEYPLPKIPSAATSSQTINISIHRIEIRAQFPQAETKMISKKEDKNILSLDQYLESRKPR